MNKYTELSDFEINKKVAEKIGLLPYLFIANDVGELIWNVPSNDNYYGFISKRGCELDFCYNPSNAMPIIIDNKIAIFPMETLGCEYWCAACDFQDIGEKEVVWGLEANNKNPLRAAMELFLLMKDAENETNNKR